MALVRRGRSEVVVESKVTLRQHLTGEGDTAITSAHARRAAWQGCWQGRWHGQGGQSMIGASKLRSHH